MKKSTFYCYWLAKTSIALADVVYIMVVTTFIYQRTSSALIASLFPLLRALATLVAGLTSPLLYPMLPFKTLLMGLQGAKALLLTALLAAFGPISESVYALLAVVLAISFMEGWGNPLLHSALPRIVPRDKLAKANGSVSIAGQSAQIAGFGLTGSAVVAWGHAPVLAFNAVLIWLSVFALMLASRRFGDAGEGAEQSSMPSASARMKEGWLILWRNRTLRTVTLMDFIEGFAGAIWIGALTLAYVTIALGQGEQWWGYINASYYVGSILGGIVAIRIAATIQNHLVACMATGSLLFGAFTFVYGLTSLPWLALLLCVAMGPASQVRDVAQQTALQTSAHPGQLPKVYAAHSILQSLTTGISVFLMGFIADVVGIRAVYLLGAILVFCSAALSFALLRVKPERVAG